MHRDVLETRPDVAWFEVDSENYLGGGPTPATLDRVRRDYPNALHGVALSLGSAEGRSETHLARVRAAVDPSSLGSYPNIFPGTSSITPTWPTCCRCR